MAGPDPQFNYNYRNDTMTSSPAAEMVYGACVTFGIVIPLMFCYYKCVKFKDKLAKKREIFRNTNTEAVASLPRVPSSCSICLDTFKQNDVIRQMPCNHEFHKTCIDPWLVNYRIECPMCRRKLNV